MFTLWVVGVNKFAQDKEIYMSAAIIEVPDSCFQCNHRMPSNGHVPDSCYVFLQNCSGGVPCDACRGARKAAEGANLHPPTPQGQNGTAGKPQVGECTTSAIA